MKSKICTYCKTEKHTKDFYNKYTESEECSCKRGLKRYYDKKDKISIQQKFLMEKNDKLLQKKNYRYKNIKQSFRSYVELQNRSKAMKRNFTKNDSENIYIFIEDI